MQLLTERLFIREHVSEDLAEMHELLSDVTAMNYLPDIRTTSLEESRLNLDTAIAENNAENRQKYFYGIFEKDSKQYIGEIGFTKKRENNEGAIFELGYFIKKAFWGNGIVTEAGLALIDYAFKELNALKIETGCVTENKGSEQVMKKLGMVKEVSVTKHVILEGMFYERVEYRLWREEWERR